MAEKQNYTEKANDPTEKQTVSDEAGAARIPLEIERKYLIAMPDPVTLAAIPGVRVLEMEQIYLVPREGWTRRIRRVQEAGETRYYYTAKRRKTALSCEEDEHEITAEEYRAKHGESDLDRVPIRKTRYAFPSGTLTAEVDIYPNWQDRAILEMELPREDFPVPLPDCLTVLREVSSDPRYKNVNLARGIFPTE